MKAFYELDSGIYTRDTQLIVFNSENVANAKAVELSSFSVLSNINSVTTLLTRDMTEKICDAMPLYNSFGLMIMLSWDGDNASLSAKIILANVDAYSSVINEDDQMGYNLDWKYPENFDIDKFLQQENKD